MITCFMCKEEIINNDTHKFMGDHMCHSLCWDFRGLRKFAECCDEMIYSLRKCYIAYDELNKGLCLYNSKDDTYTDTIVVCPFCTKTIKLVDNPSYKEL